MKIGTCIYFTGLQHDCCDSGHNYTTARGEFLCHPCLKRIAEENNKLTAECPDYLDPTPEQIAEQDTEWRELIAKMTAVNMTIAPIRKAHKDENWSGVIECPVCKGKLHLRHAACNGHMRVACETEECVNWIE